MNKTTFDPLTPEQQAELEALAALPEDEIDTKDIPEQRDWSGAKRGVFFSTDQAADHASARRGFDRLVPAAPRSGQGLSNGHQSGVAGIRRAAWEGIGLDW